MRLTAREIAARTRLVYDKNAQAFEAATSELQIFPGLADELEGFLRSTPSTGYILDLGCGVGRDTAYFSQRGRSVVAADLSQEMLRRTRSRTTSATAVQLDMNNLPFASASFAGAWVCSSLVHVPAENHHRALGEIFRVLSAGGSAAISMKAGTGEGWSAKGLLPEPRWFSYVQPENFHLLMEEAGFTKVSTTSSNRKNWFIAHGKKG